MAIQRIHPNKLDRAVIDFLNNVEDFGPLLQEHVITSKISDAVTLDLKMIIPNADTLFPEKE